MTKKISFNECMSIVHMSMIIFAIAGVLQSLIHKYYMFMIYYMIIVFINMYMSNYWAGLE